MAETMAASSRLGRDGWPRGGRTSWWESTALAKRPKEVIDGLSVAPEAEKAIGAKMAPLRATSWPGEPGLVLAACAAWVMSIWAG